MAAELAAPPPDLEVIPLEEDLVLGDELRCVLGAARAAAWVSHSNVQGPAYYDRRERLARLRGALEVYDRARFAPRPRAVR